MYHNSFDESLQTFYQIIMYREINTKELEELVHAHADIELIDVREKIEWDQIRIPSAKLLPLSSIQFRISEIDFSKPVYLFCRTGGRSGQVCGWLESQGMDVINVAGSIRQLYQEQSDIIEITDAFVPSYMS
ncbi:MAG: rhodanese-like domain-containing protein [Candidatus Gracilibacteria bacterium]|nr:rhodanese-like domain-containing protein [Candidatus Gracilibacteria bacterium]